MRKGRYGFTVLETNGEALAEAKKIQREHRPSPLLNQIVQDLEAKKDIPKPRKNKAVSH